MNDNEKTLTELQILHDKIRSNERVAHQKANEQRIIADSYGDAAMEIEMTISKIKASFPKS